MARAFEGGRLRSPEQSLYAEGFQEMGVPRMNAEAAAAMRRAVLKGCDPAVPERERGEYSSGMVAMLRFPHCRRAPGDRRHGAGEPFATRVSGGPGGGDLNLHIAI